MQIHEAITAPTPLPNPIEETFSQAVILKTLNKTRPWNRNKCQGFQTNGSMYTQNDKFAFFWFKCNSHFWSVLHFCLKPLGEHMPKAACNKTQKACDRHLVNQFTSG
jgi:hypothetical protein